ncbi:PAS domain-containing protein [Saccharopolyspora antimicrobica]|uniref:PAS domain-containing protein n=1 Tax=Saccharopolyspora antimicrobica TaxID=455193 RepID=UPI001BA5944B|nr:PAS domain-containing protein [Saccharopolyspora antimicrobica]
MDPESCGPPHGLPSAGTWRQEAITWRNRMILLLDHLPTPIALCDADGGILLANPAMAAEWGLLPGQMRGRNALDFLPAPREGPAPPDRRSRPAAPQVPLPGRGQLDPAERRRALRRGRRHPGQRHRGRSPGPDAGAPRPRRKSRNTTGRAGATGQRDRSANLALAAGGDTTARIAKAVDLTVDGVNYHLAQLSRRWNVRGRTALVARAYALGVLNPEAWPPAPTEPA